MKVLWIVNMPVGPLSERLTGKRSNGLWVDSFLKEFEGGDTEISVATAYRMKKPVKVSENGVDYYAVPDDYPLYYNENKKENLAAWKNVIDEVKPDIIQVFGTEFTHGLCALKVKGEIPAVIFMQGVTGAIAKHYLAGIPFKTAKKTLTFRDFIRRDGIIAQQKKFYLAAEKERVGINLAGAIISENDWCNAFVKSACPNVKTYYCPLSVNAVFWEYNWKLSAAERHSIICTASGYTIKGLHILLAAIKTVKEKYPDVKLYVPGRPLTVGNSLKEKLRVDGYTEFVDNLIDKYGIKDNVVWLGVLSQKELASEYSKRHVFVMPSAIENHSSSLMEAMAVGMPTITSAVGGIPEYAKHGENALLYRYDEYEILADLIDKIFSSDELAEKLSAGAKKFMTERRANKPAAEYLTDIYGDIVRKI